MVGALALAGCSFQLDPAGLVVDARPDVGDPCATPKIWEADFSSDPELLDVNGDSIPDWAFRNGELRPGSFSNGVWSAPTPPPLDTQPKQDFRTRTRVQVKMRSVADTPQTLGNHGAVFWINVGHGDADFAPLWLDANRANGTQSMHLYTKDLLQQRIELAAFSNLGLEMLDAQLDIDPVLRTVAIEVASTRQTATYVEIPKTGDDRWATVTAYSSASEFDHIKVEVCP